MTAERTRHFWIHIAGMASYAPLGMHGKERAMPAKKLDLVWLSLSKAKVFWLLSAPFILQQPRKNMEMKRRGVFGWPVLGRRLFFTHRKAAAQSVSNFFNQVKIIAFFGGCSRDLFCGTVAKPA